MNQAFNVELYLYGKDTVMSRWKHCSPQSWWRCHSIWSGT